MTTIAEELREFAETLYNAINKYHSDPRFNNCLNSDFCRDQLIAFAERAEKERVPEGWQLVPKEPTEEMKRALFINLVNADDEAAIIKAILAKAPKPPLE